MTRNWLLIIAVSGVLPTVSTVQAEDPATQPAPVPLAAQLEFFEAQVRPLLAKRCYKCHSTDTGPDNGALVLDTAAGIAAGGTRGGMLSKETPDKGLLLRVIGYADPDLEMPPDTKLPAEEIAIFERWVRDGAALPDYKVAPRPATSRIDLAAGRQFWSFQPVRPTPVPSVADTTWIRRPLDAFIRAKQLEQHDTCAQNQQAGGLAGR